MSKKHKRAAVAVTQRRSVERPRSAMHPAPSRRVLMILRIAGLLLIAAVVVAWLRPGLRVWGFHHLAFLPPWAAVLLVIAGGLSWTPLGPRAVNVLSKWLKPLANRSAVWWAIAAVVIFFGFRVSVPLLGDGPLWIKELAWIGEFEARGQNVPGTRFMMRKEPLELGLHELVFRAAAAMRKPDFPASSSAQAKEQFQKREQWHMAVARNTYSLLSVAAGALFVFMALRFARRRLKPEARAVFLITLLTGSGMLLFFGYVENYTWASLTMVAFLLAGLDDAFPPRRFPLKSLVAFGLAVGFHLSNFVLLPALLYLLYNLHVQSADEVQNRESAPNLRLRLFLAASAVVGLAGYVVVKGWKGWISIMPLLPTWSKDGYAMLTIAHAVDLINLTILILLPALLVLFALRIHRTFSWHERVQTGFIALAAAGGAAFAVLFNPNLGMARDWDLLAMALWPMVLWAAWMLSKADFGIYRAGVMSALAGFALLISVPFVLVQSFTAPSLQRYETLLSIDRARSAYGWENLAIYYESKGDLKNRIRAWKEAADISGNTRYSLNYAVALRLAGRLEEAEPIIREAAKEVPDYAYQLIYLAQNYLEKGRLEKSRDLLEYALEIDSTDAQIPKILDYVRKRIAERDAAK